MKWILAVTAVCVLTAGCSASARLGKLDREGTSASLTLPQETPISEIDRPMLHLSGPAVLDPDGREVFVMNAVLGEDGEMVATEEIEAAVKIETFRNVAERGGAVDIRFNVTVPQTLLDSRCQLQFTPILLIGKDSVELDRIFVTGDRFRKTQKKGYERYEKYLNTLNFDPDAYLDERAMRIYLERRGRVTEAMNAIVREHYTDKFLRNINDRRMARRTEMYSNMVKLPVVSEGIRLDTVIAPGSGEVRYEYFQTLSLDYTVRKFELVLESSILDIGGKTCAISPRGPLTYYVSSLSTLAEDYPERSGDSRYREALEALKRREYREAITVLANYADYNAALALAALNYNKKALEILEGMESAPKVEYLKALLYCRTMRDLQALKAYDKACAGDSGFIFRGNLDPEIRKLKNRYNLKR